MMKCIMKVRNKYVLYELRHSYVQFVTDEYWGNSEALHSVEQLELNSRLRTGGLLLRGFRSLCEEAVSWTPLCRNVRISECECEYSCDSCRFANRNERKKSQVAAGRHPVSAASGPDSAHQFGCTGEHSRGLYHILFSHFHDSWIEFSGKASPSVPSRHIRVAFQPGGFHEPVPLPVRGAVVAHPLDSGHVLSAGGQRTEAGCRCGHQGLREGLLDQ